MSIYKHMKIERVQGAGTVLEHDAEEAKTILIILKGRVKMMQYKHDLNANLEMGQLLAGEVCGDDSI
jgi:CRP-like cAMP-binding protein